MAPLVRELRLKTGGEETQRKRGLDKWQDLGANQNKTKDPRNGA